ncbi:MAG TPA: sugar transferase [Vicinamibacterales bacterium]|nr:sugar transferase [Vicinamibacterales bacterium]
MIPTPRAQMTVRTAALVLLDVAALAAGWVFASNWRFGSYWGLDFRTTHQAQLAMHAGIFLLAGILFETYDPRRPYATAAELRKLVGGYLVAGLAELLIFFFRPEPLVGRGIFAMNVAVFAGVATAGRFVYSLVGTDFFKHQALVVTSGEVGAPLLGELKRAAGAVYQIQGYVAPARDMSAPNTVPWLGDGADLTELLAARKIDTIIVSSSMECWHRYLQALIAARNRGVEIVDLASVCERFLNRIPCDQITELWLLWGLMGRSSLYVTKLKRLVDFVLAAVLLVVLSPLLLIVALTIRLFSKGPVIYTQERIGLGNRPFSVVKFRSMVHGAEDDTGPVWASEEDPRVTNVGKWLRRWRMDELPQLWNVIKGDMSLVGPRPERSIFVNEFLTAVPMYNQRHGLRPGITGWGQIHYDYAASREQTREKLEYDLFYVKNASFLLDLAILLRTTRTLVGARGR